MNSSINYLIPILFFVLGATMGLGKFEPVYPVTEIVLTNPPDTIWMSLSGCLDMIGGN